jgi:cyclic pyranopterin phosphate synthase
MRFEDIVWLARLLVSLGIKRVRFTGGEPLVRRGMADFLCRFREEFPDLAVSLTTNGVLLTRFAAEVARARLSGINVSLDTLDDEKFSAVTRGGRLSDVLSGLEAALSAGVTNIKTNTVAMRGFNEAELPDIVRFAWSLGLLPRIIEFMPLCGDIWGDEKFAPSNEIFEAIRPLGDWAPSDEGAGETRGPAKYYEDKRTGRKIGIIEAVSRHFCSECNRIRITASGHMRACLFNNEEIPLLGFIRARDERSTRRAILDGVALKPGEWRETSDGNGRMSGIGG